MRKILAVTVLAILAVLDPRSAANATSTVDMLAGVSGAAQGARADLVTASGASGIERIPLVGNVAHYRFDVRVGAGEHDVIRMHRIVRERAPWIPETGHRGVFLVPGDGWGFEANFLAGTTAPEIPDDRNLAVFLAEGEIDVWGLDFRWTLVPGDVTDLSFMADWGLGTGLADLDLALAVARSVRALTGSGLDPVHLVGFSRGGQLGWAQAAAETQRPAVLRHVSGLVSIENAWKPDDEAVRQSDCASYASLEGQLAAGVYASDYRIVADIGDLATTAPEDPSPFLPSLSNADLAEWLGASVGGGAIPHFHSVGGLVDPATLVTELLYTEPASWFAYLSGSAAYHPLRVSLDGAAIGCDELDSPFDDHFEEVAIPVLYVGVAGAYGELGIHATTLIASPDVSTLIVRRAATPDEDWGHIDPFLADAAREEIWQPILSWIEAH